jgi:hypothetical protein
MAKTRSHNQPSHEAMVKGRQISYQISNNPGSGYVGTGPSLTCLTANSEFYSQPATASSLIV